MKTNSKPSPKGYSWWVKAALKSYIDQNNIVIDERENYTRRDYIQAIRAEESKYKNLSKKTLDELKLIVDEQISVGY